MTIPEIVFLEGQISCGNPSFCFLGKKKVLVPKMPSETENFLAYNG